jgi:uncharacterized protein (TIGR03118 family)
VLFGASLPAFAAGYSVTVLTADQSGIGKFTDPNLQNPWGISFSTGGDFWVSDNNSGLSTLYTGTGQPQSLVVTIPPAAGGTKGSPSGTVYNSTSDFKIHGNIAIFLFDTEDGTISGWYGGTSAFIAVDNSSSLANYKGMELANNGQANFLYVTNFWSGTVDVFDGNFQPATLSGSFTDPNLPAGYAPFNIKNINGLMYVTYAKQNATRTDPVFCAGCGFVDIFDLNGNFKRRFASGGKLNAPWGLAASPSNFGTFSNDILVANLGDGKINAFSKASKFLGQLATSAGKVLTFPGLWDIVFGTGGVQGNTNQLFYTAGPGNYVHGRFGVINAN